MCCYYTKNSIINTVKQKRTKLQYCQQNENISILSFTGESYLLFPAPMSQAIVSLNYLHHSAVIADTIFTHLELIVSVFDMQVIIEKY